jgi:hypothetical protein
MLDKIESPSLEQIPLEVQAKMASQLSNHDLFHYSLVSTKHFNFFKNLRDARSLLRNVVQGKHTEVTATLRQNINLLFEEGCVIDCSARIFKDINPFKYALWALDIPMCRTMLGCLPEKQDNKLIINHLLLQYAQLHTEGITYWLNQNKFTEHHFDLENTIIKELQIQVNSIRNNQSYHTIVNHWRTGVGWAQTLLPINIIVEYCAPVAFNSKAPVPKAKLKIPSAKPKVTPQNWFTDELGKEVAIYRGKASVARASSEYVGVSDIDLQNLIQLHDSRKQELVDLKLQLETMLDDQPRYTP